VSNTVGSKHGYVAALMIGVMLGFSALASAQAGDRGPDGPKSATEAQDGGLGSFITTYDSVIRDIDSIIWLYQTQRLALAETRAQLSILKELMSPAGDTSGGVATKSAVEEGVEAAAVTIGAAVLSSHPVTTAVMTGLVVVNHALDEALEQADEQNARIEQRLREQREWFSSH